MYFLKAFVIKRKKSVRLKKNKVFYIAKYNY